MSNVLYKLAGISLFAQIVREYDPTAAQVLAAEESTSNLPFIFIGAVGCTVLLAVVWLLKRRRSSHHRSR